jgi:hypothetical protein
MYWGRCIGGARFKRHPRPDGVAVLCRGAHVVCGTFNIMVVADRDAYPDISLGAPKASCVVGLVLQPRFVM